jgi:hypothetical protein
MLYGDCLHCAESFCIKGDPIKTDMLRKRLVQVALQEDAAAKAREKGRINADRWELYHQSLHKRLQGLIEILDNPEVPDGAIIKLGENNNSLHGARALLNTPSAKQLESGAEEEPMIKVIPIKKIAHQ